MAGRPRPTAARATADGRPHPRLLRWTRTGDPRPQTDLGRALVALLWTDDALRSLPRGTWLAGGCVPLARALQSILGGDLVGLRPTEPRSGRPEPPLEHALLRLGDRYLDGLGVMTAWERLRYARVVERDHDPILVPATAAMLAHLNQHAATQRALTALLAPLRTWPAALWREAGCVPLEAPARRA